MKLASVSTGVAIAASILFTTTIASAQSRLGAAADSLEDSLKALAKQFERRGDRFQDEAGSLFRTIDEAREDSDRLGKEAGRNRPKWQVQPAYQELRSHMNDLGREIGRYPLTSDEKRAADAVWWNHSLTVAAWDRYGVVTQPVRPTAQFNAFERARTYVTRYLTSKYRVPARELNIGKTSDLGRIVRVRVSVRGIGTREVDVDPRSGAIVADRRG
jgi:hypothetical protein